MTEAELTNFPPENCIDCLAGIVDFFRSGDLLPGFMPGYGESWQAESRRLFELGFYMRRLELASDAKSENGRRIIGKLWEVTEKRIAVAESLEKAKETVVEVLEMVSCNQLLDVSHGFRELCYRRPTIGNRPERSVLDRVTGNGLEGKPDYPKTDLDARIFALYGRNWAAYMVRFEGYTQSTAQQVVYETIGVT